MRSRPVHSLCLALVLTAALVVPAALAADNAAVLGKWTVSMTMQEQAVEVALEIKEAEDGGLTGTWTGPRGTDTLNDVKWDGTELTFSRTVSRQGQEFSLTHVAKVTGDTLEGKITMPQREIPFTGKRVG